MAVACAHRWASGGGGVAGSDIVIRKTRQTRTSRVGRRRPARVGREQKLLGFLG
jgi:hypothetical protein